MGGDIVELSAKHMKGKLKVNEARLPFRILAFLIAIPAWLIAVVALTSIISNGVDKYMNWSLVTGMSLFALSMSWVAIAGYMPKVLWGWFSRGGTADEDLK